jgi:GNAT superfamily N-acetyltransferase
MFAAVELAKRIEAAEAHLSASLAHAAMAAGVENVFVEEIDGGVAIYTGPSSPMNKLIGAGFGEVAAERLSDIEKRFAAVGAPLQAEVSTLANPAFAAHLTRHGYVLQNFENVLGRPLADGDRDPREPDGITLAPMNDAQTPAWLDAAITGFQHPDDRGVAAEAMPPREILEDALRPMSGAGGFRRYGAWIDGVLAGVASLRLDGAIAQLCGAATLPPFRRRGVQAALLRRRLADAVSSGCDLALLTTQPGSTSQQNGHRQGFALLYPRAILVRHP